MRAVLKHLLRRQPGGLPKWPFLSCNFILLGTSLYVLAVHHPLDPVTVGLCFFIALAGVGLLMLPYYIDNQAWNKAQERRRLEAAARAAAPKTEIDEIQDKLRTLATERAQIHDDTRKANETLTKVLGPERPVREAPTHIVKTESAKPIEVTAQPPSAPAVPSSPELLATIPDSVPSAPVAAPALPLEPVGKPVQPVAKSATPSLFPPEVIQQVRSSQAPAATPPPAPKAAPARGSLLGKAFATAQSPAHTQAVNRLIQTGFRKEEPKADESADTE